MSDDPYQVLGVEKTATADEIRTAYRRLAKKLHPDLNPGNSDAEERFKKLSAANGLLSDPEKRARYDRGEIDASGQERPPQSFYRDYAGAGTDHPYTSSAGFADFGAAEDVLSGFFRRGGGGGRAEFRMPGHDVQYRLPVDFLDAVNGATTRITLPEGGTLDVRIPAGARDGQVLRLKGKGGAGFGGPPGDALIELEVRPHGLFRREGDDIRIELPVSLTEAVLGGRVEVPTPAGPVMMTIPKGSNTGRTLRLRGRGVRRADGTSGDLYATLMLVLPDAVDPELEAFAESWTSGKAHDPRREMER